MPYSEIFTSCRVSIYDINERLLVDTTILQYERQTLTMTINCTDIDLAQQNTLKCHIFYKDSLYKFNGKLKRKNKLDGNYIISLFNGEKIEARISKRHSIEMEADVICKIDDKNKVEAYDAPIKVELLNISTSGVLLKALKNTFAINDCFQLLLKIGDNNIVINNMVVRITDSDNDDYSSYGCEFLSLSDKAKSSID